MTRIDVRAVPNCKNCMGSGVATPLHALCGTPVCPCVTEQLRIITSDTRPAGERYSPGKPEYVKETEVGL